MTDKQLNPRDVFECEYIARHMAQDVYADAKSSLESLRNGLTYDDEDLNGAFYRWIDGLDWESPDPQKSNRIGDIHIGGEMLPEFLSGQVANSGHWCKGCGVDANHLHMPSCPTLKSKL